MTIEFRQCHPEHVLLVRPQPAQRDQFSVGVLAGIEKIALQGPSFSGWVDHRCVGCAGFVPILEHHARAWALLSKDCLPHMLAVTRFVRKVMARSAYTRIDAAIPCDFAPGRRWAEALGFVVEAERMKKYDAFGRDATLYAFVKD